MEVNSFAFWYLSPASWQINTLTWEESSSRIVPSCRKTRRPFHYPACHIPRIWVRDIDTSYFQTNETRYYSYAHACRMLGFQASLLYSPSLESSSSSSVAFLVDFFFFFLFFPLAPVDRATGWSRILRISSSVIFFSVLYWSKLGPGGALKRTIPFFVMADLVSVLPLTHPLRPPKTYQWLLKVLRLEPSLCLLRPRTVGERSIVHILPHQPWPLFHRQAASN